MTEELQLFSKKRKSNKISQSHANVDSNSDVRAVVERRLERGGNEAESDVLRDEIASELQSTPPSEQQTGAHILEANNDTATTGKHCIYSMIVPLMPFQAFRRV